MKVILIATCLLQFLLLGSGCNRTSGNNLKSKRFTDSSEVLMKLEKWRDADEILKDAIKLNQENDVALNDIAVCKFKEHAPFDSVLYYIDRSKNANPHYPASYLNKGSFYFQLKQYKKATELEMIGIQKTDSTISTNWEILSEAYSVMGKCAVNLNDYQSAITYFNLAIKFDKNHPDVYRGIGFCYEQGGYFNEGIITLTKAIQQDSMQVYEYINRGVCFSGIGKFDLALSDLNKALNMHSDDTQAYWTRGLIYEQMKEIDKAIVDFTKCDSFGVAEAKVKLATLQK